MNQKLKKKIILNIPYVAIGLFATNLGEAWRIADGINASEKLQGLIIGGGFQNAFTNPLPSLHHIQSYKIKIHKRVELPIVGSSTLL